MKKFNLVKEIIIADRAALMQAINSSRSFAITHDGRIVYPPFAPTDIFIYQGSIAPQPTSALTPQKPKSLQELLGKEYKIVEDEDRVLIKAAGAWQDLISINVESCDYDDSSGDGIDKFKDKELEEMGWQVTEFGLLYRDIVDQLEARCDGILFCIENEGEHYQFSGMGFITDMECARSTTYEFCKAHVEKALSPEGDFSTGELSDDEKAAARFFGVIS